MANVDLIQWLDQVKKSAKHLKFERIEQSLSWLQELDDGREVMFADSLSAQGITIAEELLALNCDSQTIAAGLIYPALQAFKPKNEVIEKKLGKIVLKLYLGVQRMEMTVDSKHSGVDKIRRMLLSMVDDIRIVLLKLAERLSVLKYLKYVDEKTQREVAEQTSHLYAPLANRLGIGQLKWQLEDLAFRFTEPEEYQNIKKALNMRRGDRERFIENFQHELETLMKNAGITNYNISGRAKHIYSIHRKIERKKVDFEEIYDASAFRILVPTINDCYAALSAAHANWEHIPQEFDDYIAKPKPNGYQSIHTAVIGAKNINVEIQFRTFQMHEEAELGVAAHWKYKEGVSAQSTYEDKIAWLREVMDWQKELSEETEENDTYSKIFEDRIYVFTPTGDVFDLPAGSTPLDFAYHVHTNVGHRCKGAKVNDALVPLTHQLRTGDRISIMTSKEDHPSRDWLNPDNGYLKTPSAISKVKHFFKRENHEHHIQEGQALWEKTYRKAGLKKNSLTAAFERFNFKHVDDLLAAIGSGQVGITSVLNEIQDKEKTVETTDAIDDIATLKPSKHKIPEFKGVDDLLTTLAGCCRPIPGDSILGYITKGRGITIHQKDCKNIQKSLELQPERIMELDWGSEKPQAYPVDLIIIAENRHALLRDVSSVISGENIPLLGLNSRTNKADNSVQLNLTIEIKSLEPMNKLLNTLRQLDGVIKALRR